MLTAHELLTASQQVREKNYRFRKYLKTHADENLLDEQFKELHNALFAVYDCRKCRNCCKSYSVFFENEEEVRTASDYLGISVEQLKADYLKESFESYEGKQHPCAFLNDDMSCVLSDSKPESCKKFPYTDQPNRMGSLIGILEFAEVCPVVFEIVEQLKKRYHFR